MTPRWLILADDRSGAADAGVAFARRGHDTEVRWDDASQEDGLAVLALDLDSRAATAAEAAARHGDAVRRALLPGRTLFKKIDSTLRGHPAVELAGIAQALRDQGRPSWGLLAPANPAMRRTTRDGRVLVDGVPLEDTTTWKRDHSYPDADLAAIARSAGLRAISLPLAALRGDESAVRGAFAAAAASSATTSTILIGDAETDDDLDRLVAAARACPPGFLAGTAGLANAVARAMPGRPTAGFRLEPTTRGTLVAVGTAAPVSREAARRLATHDRTHLVSITLASPAGHWAVDTQVAADIGACLAHGDTVVALLDGPEVAGDALDSGYLRSFAAALADGLGRMGALVVTGGETAALLLAQCKVHGIRLLDELEPGVALGLTRGAVEVPLVTKPGAFGDERSLRRCLDALQARRRTA